MLRDVGSVLTALFRLDAGEGAGSIDLLLVLGFATGIALVNRVMSIHRQVRGFVGMAFGLGLIAAGTILGDDLLLIVTRVIRSTA